MPIIADRVAETTATTGTGTLQLLGAKHGYQTFVSGVGSGATTYFVVLDLSTGDWELCSGVVTAGSPTTLTRGTVLDGSNGPGVSVAFAAGLKDVFVSAPAARLPVLDPITGALSIPGDLAITGSVYSSASTADAGRSTNKFRDLWLSRDAHIGGALTAGASTLASLILTAALTLANGGTGLSAWTGGDLPYYASGTALSKLAIGGANTVLVSSGAAPQWASSLTGLTAVSATNLTGTLQTPAQPNITSVGTLSSLVITAPLAVTSGGNGLSTATVGDLRYGSGANTLAALAGNVTSTKKFLTQTGTGSISAAPGWGQVLAGDVQAGIFSGSFTFSSLLAASVSGNAATATALATSRTLWGQAFDGSANVSGALSGATTGGFSGIVTASGFTVSAAVGKLIPGATSFSLRNSADTADNLLITDAGAVTVRALLTANAGLTVGSGLTTLSYAINAQNDVLILGNTHVGTSASSRVLFANNTSSGAAQIIHYGGNHATLPNQLWIVNANPASLVLGTNNVAALTLASGGAATFAGTVVANGMITAHNPAGDTAQLSLLAQPNSSLSRDWRFASNNGTFGDLQLLRSTTAGGTTTTLAATFDATAFTLASHQFFGTDNAYDIGASGANRPRNVYVANGVAALNATIGSSTANSPLNVVAGDSNIQIAMINASGVSKWGMYLSGGTDLGFYNYSAGNNAITLSDGSAGTVTFARPVIIGTNPGGSQLLRVGGSFTATQVETPIIKATTIAGVQIRISSGTVVGTFDNGGNLGVYGQITGSQGLRGLLNGQSLILAPTTAGSTSYVAFYESGLATLVGSMGLANVTTASGTASHLYLTANYGLVVINTYAGGALIPQGDNALSCGTSVNRWTALWAVNGTIQTSVREAKNINATQPSDTDIMLAVRSIETAAYTYKDDAGWNGEAQREHGDEIKQHRHFGVMHDTLPAWAQTTENGVNPMNVAAIALAGVRVLENRIRDLEKQLSRTNH
jgi:hypothetical protein